MQGMHIAFAGIDGSGKSTQAELLVGWLQHKGKYAILREGKCDFVSQISGMIAMQHGLEGNSALLGEDTYLICLAYDVLREALYDVRPYVDAGATVVCARSPYCRLAGGIRRGATTIESAKEISLFGGSPDVTIWLDLSPEIARERIQARSLDAPSLQQLEDYRNAFTQVLPPGSIHINCNRASTQIEIHEMVTNALNNIIV
jgi:dTMP kinase